MKKLTKYITIIITVILISSCGKIEIVLDTEINHTKDLEEFKKFMGENDYNENYNFESFINEKANIVFNKDYKKDSKLVTCTITAPDVYSYIINNIEELSLLTEEELYNTLLEYFGNNNYETRQVTIEVPVEYKEGKLIVDTNVFEYKDAISGGMYTVLNEVYIKYWKQVFFELEDKYE